MWWSPAYQRSPSPHGLTGTCASAVPAVTSTGSDRDTQSGEETAALDRAGAVVLGIEPAAFDRLHLVVVMGVISVRVRTWDPISIGHSSTWSERSMNGWTGNFTHTA